MAETEDPYSLFGDESDEEEGAEGAVSELSQNLVEQANAKIQQSNNPLSSSLPSPSSLQPPDVPEREDDLSHLSQLELPWQPPLYKGPILLVDALPYGGGRGYVASRRLEAGTLVLIEESVMKWPAEQLGKKLDIISVQHLLEHPNAKTIVRDLEDFHPTKVSVQSRANDKTSKESVTDMIEMLKGECDKKTVSDIVSLSNEKGICGRDSFPLSEIDIFRLLLALRYNGLESGVYEHVAMLNHSCHPNCTKFMPSDEKALSEVRTTRVVEAGEPLTISYLPRIMCHSSRRVYLWRHHRFDIGESPKESILALELVGKKVPPSSKTELDTTASKIEQTTEDLEKLHRELMEDADTGNMSSEGWESVEALEQAALELYRESQKLVENEHHLLLVPCLVVHVDACDLVLRSPSLASSVVRFGVLTRQVESVIKLISIQKQLLGRDHFDLARSNLDLANAIGELLSRSVKSLLNLQINGLDSFKDWSILESQARAEHRRIKLLYPEDGPNFINKRN